MGSRNKKDIEKAMDSADKATLAPAHEAAGIRVDPKNYRQHGEENKRLIHRSLDECGAGRSIVADADGELIAGNGVFAEAQALGIPLKVVETDGSELVVVKRTDLKPGDERRKLLAMADNATSDSSEWDFDALAADFDMEELGEWEIDVQGMDCTIEMPELADGDKEPFEQMVFSLAEPQAEIIRDALARMKASDEFASVETYGNENSNGNALFAIVMRYCNDHGN